ncbi:MAG: hypothetical protein HY076_07935 [Candidatus Eisenbacteria bacterium]|uniref:Outer membrane protein beta-barrel domain-containing protein n=1 Tax=Eiseniibacteriota bacterium TaxID=2212470 RepID=A0A9D6QKG9_UNCEI|nr:hypothetical protein [Candidatus Eisenbacteria bacterium]MBI3540186.1 hypothetical protein [Candidatus Eisenbacteria bacterium]
MRKLPTLFVLALVALFATAVAAPAVADPGSMLSPAAGFTPEVPVSAFAGSASWFDPSRLHFSTTVSVGSGWGGSGTSALQVTQMSYQFGAPLAVRVGVGNTFGGGAAARSAFGSRAGFANSMFLEGFEVAYRPHPSFQINIQYRDIRSPLQYSPYYGYGFAGR